MSKVNILFDTCKGVEDCGICIFVCPNELYEPSGKMNSNGFVPPRMVAEDRCVQCMNCMISCPDMAIVVAKKKKKEEPDE